jgi:hypothetical protein
MEQVRDVDAVTGPTEFIGERFDAGRQALDVVKQQDVSHCASLLTHCAGMISNSTPTPRAAPSPRPNIRRPWS